MARAVSSKSDDVIPMWIYLEASPTYAATVVRNAITACLTVFSISSIREGSNFALLLIFSRALFGISPLSINASHTAISIWSHFSYLFFILHILAISGLL